MARLLHKPVLVHTVWLVMFVSETQFGSMFNFVSPEKNELTVFHEDGYKQLLNPFKMYVLFKTVHCTRQLKFFLKKFFCGI